MVNSLKLIFQKFKRKTRKIVRTHRETRRAFPKRTVEMIEAVLLPVQCKHVEVISSVAFHRFSEFSLESSLRRRFGSIKSSKVLARELFANRVSILDDLTYTRLKDSLFSFVGIVLYEVWLLVFLGLI